MEENDQTMLEGFQSLLNEEENADVTPENNEFIELEDELMNDGNEEEVEEVLTTPTEPEKIKLDNGLELTLDELKKGYLRQQDYTTKTQQLSENRKELESKNKEIESYIQSIPMLTTIAENNVNEALKIMNSREFQELASNDPTVYVAEKAKLEAFINENTMSYHKMQNDLSQYQAKTVEEFNMSRAAQLKESDEVLASKYPKWKSGEMKQELVKYLTDDLKLPLEVMNNITTATEIEILHKSMMYDKLVNSVASKKQKVLQNSNTISPNSKIVNSELNQVQKPKIKLKNASSDDMVSAFKNLLG